MKSFIEALNHPAIAFHKEYKAVSWGMVMLVVVLNGVLEPVLQHFYGINTLDIDVLRMLKITGLGILSYVLICLAFWAVCKCFDSKKSIIDHINAWGITFAPTVICAVVVAFTEVFFFVFWNSTIWGMILNIVFVGILIWKSILYFVYLKEFANLNGWRLLAGAIVMGIIILVMAALNGAVGLKTPIL